MSIQAFFGVNRRIATITLTGDLDEGAVPLLRSMLERATADLIGRLVLDMEDLMSISAAAVRCLASVQQELAPQVDITFVGVRPEVGKVLQLTGFDQAVRQRVA